MGSDLTGPLERLRDDLRTVRLELEVPGTEEARRARDDLAAQVDDYILPRLRQMDAPALIVVGGSTGAGKSTLVNSLVDAVVSPAGLLRPTTRAPVLACHPDDVRWFEDDRVLPGLPRVTGGSGGPGTLQLVATPALPEGLALLDSPDIDSVLAENRALANQLLAAADGWLFVTTAARYADAVPWEFLRSARERGTVLSIVLNRVPGDADREVPAHLRQMLADERLDFALVLGRQRVIGRPGRGRRARGGRAAVCGRGAPGRGRRGLRGGSARGRSCPAERVAPARRGACPLARGRRDGRRDARSRDTSGLAA